MAKDAKESPADKAKRELAEKAAETTLADKITEVDGDTGETNVVDTKGALSPEEIQGIEAGFADDPVVGNVPEKPAEDPERVKAREAQFARAEQFERERAARIHAARSGAPMNVSAMVGGDVEEDPNVKMLDDDWVAVRMPKASYDALLTFAAALPVTTPREHAMCGYGIHKITVGMIKDAAGLPRGR